mmetsp:Transcript_51646/g.144313  ORF Transcript_51646/g.144313 Transcript_51646/m.144313 type:complete len:211 (-) Transcript_51646:501-1133(-)
MHLVVLDAAVTELVHVRSPPCEHLPLLRHCCGMPHPHSNVHDSDMCQGLKQPRLSTVLHAAMAQDAAEAAATRPNLALRGEEQGMRLVRGEGVNADAFEPKNRNGYRLDIRLHVEAELEAGVGAGREHSCAEPRQDRQVVQRAVRLCHPLDEVLLRERLLPERREVLRRGRGELDDGRWRGQVVHHAMQACGHGLEEDRELVSADHPGPV